MKDFATALALVPAIEGIPYLFADGMKPLMAQATALPAAAPRATGLAAACLAATVVWVIGRREWARASV
jgi:uncharacterized protein YjeT (DUF2065 family)